MKTRIVGSGERQVVRVLSLTGGVWVIETTGQLFVYERGWVLKLGNPGCSFTRDE